MNKTAVEDADDQELVSMWKDDNHQPAYDELRNRHEGMVYQASNKYRSSPVPQPAIESEAWNHFDDAVQNYQPDKGAKFPTYLNYRLRKLDRFNKRHQNIARIPEATARKIGDYDTAKNELEHELGRQPDAQEIADKTDMSENQVNRLNKSRRQDLFEGRFEGEQHADQREDRANKLLHDIRGELSGQEQEVYDHLLGIGDTEKVESKQALARKLGLSPGRVSQISTSISNKIKPHTHKF